MARRVVILAVLIAVVAGLRATAPRRFEARAVEETVRAFMAARLARNERLARTFLTNDLHRTLTESGDFSLTGAPNPHYHSFRIVEVSESDGSWIVLVVIREEVAGRGLAGWFEERIRVDPVGDGYRVAGIERGPYQAAT